MNNSKAGCFSVKEKLQMNKDVPKIRLLYNFDCIYHPLLLSIQIQSVIKGGFPVMAETTRNHIFSKEISQVIIAAMVLAPNFY